MSGEEQASARTFDRWAGSYDRSRILAAWRSAALRELELSAQDRFLDVACGGGRLLADAAPRVAFAAGVDISARMVERARRRAAGHEVDVRVGSAQELPFEDGSFTVVSCTTALHHFPRPEAAAGEIARVLASGGRVVLGDMVRDTPPLWVADRVLRRFEPGHVAFQHSRGLAQLLTGAGLSVTRTKHRLARTYALVVATKA